MWERGRVRERGGCGRGEGGRREGVGDEKVWERGRVRERGGCGRGVCLLTQGTFTINVCRFRARKHQLHFGFGCFLTKQALTHASLFM